ncbi:uncharacterized protein TNCV_1606511 [Trichonephila clavipes]|nr:uncharacterized protein TNCV_1606511 [Trichonephila clavipes]
MRCIGKGAESARMFCGIMNLPPPPTKFSKYNHILLQATRETQNTVWQKLFVKQLMKMIEKGTLLLLLMVAGRSVVFSSKNGWRTVTSVDTGKVIDVEVFQNVFVRTKLKHLQNCKRNFEGYSGKMEVAGALSIFQRSQSLQCSVHKIFRRWDSKAFTSLSRTKYMVTIAACREIRNA